MITWAIVFARKKENVKIVTTIIITLCNYVLHPCIFHVKWIYTIRASIDCLKGFGILGGLFDTKIIILALEISMI